MAVAVFETVDIDALLKLLTLRTKRELRAFARDTIIHHSDFAALIFTCETGQMPWRHQIQTHERFPEHLILNEEDHAAFSNAKVGPHTKETKKATNKIFQMFEERRWLVGHIFYNKDLTDWHLFYFDQRDQEDRRNHWKHGPHIHFVNVVWPNLDPAQIWESFCRRKELPKGALHIRYKRRDLADG